MKNDLGYALTHTNKYSFAIMKMTQNKKGIIKVMLRILFSPIFLITLMQCIIFDMVHNAFIKKKMVNIHNFIFEYKGKNIEMYLPGVYYHFGRNEFDEYGIFKTKAFAEIGILEKWLPYFENSEVILDIGANIGSHSVFFSLFSQAVRIYAFEPIKDIFFKLKENLKLNGGLGKVELCNYALGEADSRAEISAFNPYHLGATALKTSVTGEIEVRTLDSLNLNRVDFIKIDTEGMELEVLGGGWKPSGAASHLSGWKSLNRGMKRLES